MKRGLTTVVNFDVLHVRIGEYVKMAWRATFAPVLDFTLVITVSFTIHHVASTLVRILENACRMCSLHVVSSVCAHLVGRVRTVHYPGCAPV